MILEPQYYHLSTLKTFIKQSCTYLNFSTVKQTRKKWGRYRDMHPQDMMLPLKCESSSNPQEIYKSIRLGKQCLVNTRKTDFHLSH